MLKTINELMHKLNLKIRTLTILFQRFCLILMSYCCDLKCLALGEQRVVALSFLPGK